MITVITYHALRCDCLLNVLNAISQYCYSNGAPVLMLYTRLFSNSGSADLDNIFYI